MTDHPGNLAVEAQRLADQAQRELEARSWAPEVFVEGSWSRNALRFRTEDEAATWGRNLLMRWFVPTDSRAVPSDDRPNYRLDGELIFGLCADCDLDALPGRDQCAGHDRLGTYTEHERSGGIAANE